MSEPIRLFNKRELLNEFLRVTPYDVSYITLRDYEKKGYLQALTYMQDGKRKVPVFDEFCLRNFILALEQAKREGKVRLKRRDRHDSLPS